MFLGLQVVDELVPSWKALAWDAAGAAVEMTVEVSVKLVDVLDMATEISFASVGLDTQVTIELKGERRQYTLSRLTLVKKNKKNLPNVSGSASVKLRSTEKGFLIPKTHEAPIRLHLLHCCRLGRCVR